jgi:hypothetical protein
MNTDRGIELAATREEFYDHLLTTQGTKELNMDTNAKIADLLKAQTWGERMELAKYIAEAAQDWASTSGVDTINDEYFAQLLDSWADSVIDDTPGD